jgi:RNA ligase (TIGR02306 family)
MSSLIVKVCSIYKIEKHPNADRLSIVTIDNESGWNCIVGLDQYKVGDKVVYVPPDCIIPPALIEKYNLEYLKHNGRTGTVKLRGFISQGLVLDLPEGNWKVGDDIANVLGITKYEVPEPTFSLTTGKQTSKKKLNSLFDKYTDIENIKNFGEVFSDEDFVVVTEKIHGCNARYGMLPIEYNKNLPLIDKIKFLWYKYLMGRKYEFVYGSHNVQLTSGNRNKNFYGDDVWGRIAKKYDLANKIPPNYVLYGEIYGKGIQDLTYGLDDIDILFFDVKVFPEGRYLRDDEFLDFCIALHLPVVPLIAYCRFDINKLSEWTNGMSKVSGANHMREGCVVKTIEEKNSPQIGRKILKSVSTEYLSRKGGTEFK